MSLFRCIYKNVPRAPVAVIVRRDLDWPLRVGLPRRYIYEMNYKSRVSVPWDMSAWTDFAPLSCKVRAASERVLPESIMSSTRIAT
jgi:hypothetical protein